MNICWPIAAAIVSTCCFFTVKAFVDGGNPIVLTLAVVLNVLVIGLYYKSLSTSESGATHAVITGLSIILGVVIVALLFGRKLTRMDGLGIAIIILGVALVVVPKPKSALVYTTGRNGNAAR